MSRIGLFLETFQLQYDRFITANAQGLVQCTVHCTLLQCIQSIPIHMRSTSKFFIYFYLRQTPS
jgi:hypothetical protein